MYLKINLASKVLIGLKKLKLLTNFIVKIYTVTKVQLTFLQAFQLMKIYLQKKNRIKRIPSLNFKTFILQLYNFHNFNSFNNYY